MTYSNQSYIIELAGHISVRNINFYIDACRAMSAVNSSVARKAFAAVDGRGLERAARSKGLKAGPQVVLEAVIRHVQAHYMGRLSEGMKLAGYLMLDRVGESVFGKEDAFFANYPFHFLCRAVHEDLGLHGQAQSGFLLENFFDELAELKIIDPSFRGLFPKEPCLLRYSLEDIALLFLGSSLAARGALLPLVPFPVIRLGFVARLLSGLKRLLPKGTGEAFLEPRRRLYQ